mmetsp:Transcript_91787/g.163360  ORF Transcript_91787/g.163360 Transcript_91787/m.163360 type:complete len:117 (+) Transcript_91787:63-413(+)
MPSTIYLCVLAVLLLMASAKQLQVKRHEKRSSAVDVNVKSSHRRQRRAVSACPDEKTDGTGAGISLEGCSHLSYLQDAQACTKRYQYIDGPTGKVRCKWVPQLSFCGIGEICKTDQ